MTITKQVIINNLYSKRLIVFNFNISNSPMIGTKINKINEILFKKFLGSSQFRFKTVETNKRKIIIFKNLDSLSLNKNKVNKKRPKLKNVT